MLAQAVDFVAGFGVLVYLAHIVAPYIFGVVSLATAIVTIASTVLAGSMADSLVAQKLTNRRAQSTVWWLAIIPATLLAIALVIIALLADYRRMTLVIVSLMALTAPLLCAATFTQALLQQRLRFRSVAFARLTGSVGSTLAVVGLGLGGLGYLALVARALLPPAFVTFVGLVVARWRPYIDIDRFTLVRIRGYVSRVAGYNILNYFNRYGDNLLVGGFLGSTALGLYALAYRFIEVPVAQVGTLAQFVTFPTVVHISDAARFRAAFLRSQRVLVWAAAPLGLLSLALGDAAIPLLMGARWEEAGTVMQIFGAVVLLQIAANQAGVIFLARAATGLLLRWALVSTPIILGAFAIGLLGGIVGIAYAYLAANLILFYPAWQIAGRPVGLTCAAVLRSLVVVLGFAFGLAASILALRALFTVDSIPKLVVVGVVGAAVYWLGALALDNDLRKDVAALLTTTRGRRDSPDRLPVPSG
jgi:PST family polysaccharide transporter